MSSPPMISFDIPANIPMTPTMTAVTLVEFLKHIFYLRDQIDQPFERLLKSNKDSKFRTTRRGLNIFHLEKTMKECADSFKLWMEHQHMKKIADIHSTDVMIVFGQSHLKPLELYSLRFYMTGDHESIDPETAERWRRRITQIISRSLLNLHVIVPNELPKTKCKILINVDPDLRVDGDFFPVQKVLRAEPKQLVKINIWNKFIANKLASKCLPSNDLKKENRKQPEVKHVVEEVMEIQRQQQQQRMTQAQSTYAQKVKGQNQSGASIPVMNVGAQTLPRQSSQVRAQGVVSGRSATVPSSSSAIPQPVAAMATKSATPSTNPNGGSVQPPRRPTQTQHQQQHQQLNMVPTGSLMTSQSIQNYAYPSNKTMPPYSSRGASQSGSAYSNPPYARSGGANDSNNLGQRDLFDRRVQSNVNDAAKSIKRTGQYIPTVYMMNSLDTANDEDSKTEQSKKEDGGKGGDPQKGGDGDGDDEKEDTESLRTKFQVMMQQNIQKRVEEEKRKKLRAVDQDEEDNKEEMKATKSTALNTEPVWHLSRFTFRGFD